MAIAKASNYFKVLYATEETITSLSSLIWDNQKEIKRLRENLFEVEKNGEIEALEKENAEYCKQLDNYKSRIPTLANDALVTDLKEITERIEGLGSHISEYCTVLEPKQYEYASETLNKTVKEVMKQLLNISDVKK